MQPPPPLIKVTSLFFSNPLSKLRSCQAPLFENLVGGLTPPAERGRSAHYEIATSYVKIPGSFSFTCGFVHISNVSWFVDLSLHLLIVTTFLNSMPRSTVLLIQLWKSYIPINSVRVNSFKKPTTVYRDGEL